MFSTMASYDVQLELEMVPIFGASFRLHRVLAALRLVGRVGPLLPHAGQTMDLTA